MSSPSLTQQKVRAAAELARHSLIGYAQVCDGKYVASEFHHFLAEKLEAVAGGSLKRLILNVPPRHGKSRLTTVELPTWLLGRSPATKIILTSYSGSLAVRHSKEARARMATPIYKVSFPQAVLNPRDMGADEWSTTKGGSYKAVGIGGSLTGHGAELLIVDDPFKDFEEAHSPTMRENVWQWFLSTAYTRLSPEGACIIIMTRWHEDDLVGRLTDPKRVQEMADAGIGDGEKWQTLNLPALAKPGDPLGREPGAALFPENFPEPRLRAIRQSIGSYLWSALYDGEPTPEGGNYVNGEHFMILNRDSIPEGMRWFRYWDLATSSKTTADFTAGVKGAIGPAPNAPKDWMNKLKEWPKEFFYLSDMIAGQWEWPRAREKIKSTAELERIRVGVEAVSGFKTGYANLREAISTEISMQDFGADRDKLTRALPWIAKVEAKKVVLVAGDWIPSFKQQIESFPNGAHDDMVDAVSGVHNMLTSVRKILVA